jgi:uncharacterized Zn-finger protein
MNHRIEKLSTLLQTNETQSKVTNIISEISIGRKNPINETSDDNSCSSTLKVKPFLMSESKRLKVKNNTCEKCKKRFPSQSHLNIHKRIHSKQKPFACDQCRKTFTQIGHLSAHKRLHSGEKPYHCGLCQMTFSQIGSLIRHKRMHTGEKPFQCDLCQKTFAQSNHLTVHKRMHTGGETFRLFLVSNEIFRSI